jgi:hypothetical protein
MKSTYWILLLVGLATPATRVDADVDPGHRSVVLRAAGHSFVLHPPEGAYLVTVEEVSHSCGGGGILPPPLRQAGMIACMFLQPRGAVVYVAADPRQADTSELLDAAVESALLEYRRTTPQMVVEGWEMVATGDGRPVRAAILRTTVATDEAVAFIGERTALIRIGAWVADDRGGRQRAVEVLRAVVAGYASSAEVKDQR